MTQVYMICLLHHDTSLHDMITTILNASCLTDINDCLASECSINSECVDQLNGYTCNCSRGFEDQYCTTSEYRKASCIVVLKRTSSNLNNNMECSILSGGILCR